MAEVATEPGGMGGRPSNPTVARSRYVQLPQNSVESRVLAHRFEYRVDSELLKRDVTLIAGSLQKAEAVF